MLSILRTNSICGNEPLAQVRPVGEDKWARDMAEDTKTAIDLLFKFKKELDKLHPEVLTVIENMMQIRNRY